MEELSECIRSSDNMIKYLVLMKILSDTKAIDKKNQRRTENITMVIMKGLQFI